MTINLVRLHTSARELFFVKGDFVGKTRGNIRLAKKKSETMEYSVFRVIYVKNKEQRSRVGAIS